MVASLLFKYDPTPELIRSRSSDQDLGDFTASALALVHGAFTETAEDSLFFSRAGLGWVPGRGLVFWWDFGI